MEVAGVALAVVAIVLAVSIEWMRRPSLDIKADNWRARGPVPWTFATVRVYNRPLPKPFSALIVRGTAECCEVTLEFREPGKSYLSLPQVPARWSSHPEPLRSIAIIDENGVPSMSTQYDPTVMTSTKRLDIPASDGGEEVAIAFLTSDGAAAAFGAESYAFPGWMNPDWRLERRVYEVSVYVRGSGVSKKRRFSLDNLAVDFARFAMLEPA